MPEHPTHPEHPEHPDNPSRYEVIVNGQTAEVPAAMVTFNDIVAIAFPDKVGNPDLTFVIIYRKAEEPREGSLAEGGSVEVKHRGTVFNVTFTRRS